MILKGLAPLNFWPARCEYRIGTGLPRARTQVIYVDLGYWAISGSIHPKGDPASWGINSSVFRIAVSRRGHFLNESERHDS